MAKHAVRITDPSDHGGMVTMGYPVTLIGGKFAARIGDSHACPMHGGGPIIEGSPTIWVGSRPLSYQAATEVFIGPPDHIASGAPDVLVDSAGGALGALLRGLFLAGYTQLARLLGEVYPRAVTQPDGSVVVEYSEAISVKGTVDFQAKVVQRLEMIRGMEAGQQTLSAIDSSGKHMTVVEFTGPNSYAGPNPSTVQGYIDATAQGNLVFDGAGNALLDANGNQYVGTGNGVDTEVQFNPNLTLPNKKDPSHPVPNDAILFHELTHGAHEMNGTYDAAPVTNGYDTLEEQVTISTGDPNEAEYLLQRGFPWQRTDHDNGYAPNP